MAVTGEYGRVSEAVAGLTARPADLLFLDVHMPRAGGLALLERIPNRPPAVVCLLTSAFARRESAPTPVLDSLLRPFDDERFRQTLSRARTFLSAAAASGPTIESDAIFCGMRSGFAKRLAVKHAGAVVLLRLDDVDWMETSGNYVRIHTRTSHYLMRESLARLEEQLDPAQFVRINRSAIINLDRVARLYPGFDGDRVLELGDGTRLPLLAKYRGRLCDLVGRF